MSEAVTTSVDADGIATLTMDLPGKTMNTLGAELTPALFAAVAAAAADPRVTGIVLTSGKPTFVAGADLKEMDGGGAADDAPARPQTPEELLEALLTLSRDLRTLETCGKPVACAINGTAMGGGLEIALACHYRVVVDDPKILIGLPESNVGLLPGGGGTQRLPRLIGIAAALPLLLQGTAMSPRKAEEAGIVDAVVPADQLVAEAKRWLREEGDPVAPWDRKGFTLPGGGPSAPDNRNLFSVSSMMTRANTFGNLPAPAAIAAAVYEGTQLPFDTALRVEGKYFVTLFTSSVSKALIRTMFVSKGKADKLSARPAGVEKRQYTRIGVLGAGTMGAGLALTAAKAGIDVVLLDRDLPAAEKGKAYAAQRLARDVEKGRRTREKADAALARIHPTVDYADLADVPLVVEAVFEDPAVKEGVITQADAVLANGAVLASNTSAIPITGLAGFSRRPERFIGMHFFSPVERMGLVEIIRGEQTSDETLAHALDLAQALRKTPIVVNDSPGFFTSRFIGSFITASLAMINEGVNPNLVENGARMLGMPMGALTVSDSIGLDLSVGAARNHAEQAGTAVPDLGVSGFLVDQGRHGRKNGKGFYDYHDDGTKSLWPGLADALPKPAEQPTIDEVKTRILYAQLAEGARAFAEGVVPSVIDGDLGATLGVGFPAYLGGPFLAIDTIGVAEFVRESDRLAAAYGKQYEVPRLLRDMAENGQTFYGRTAVVSPGAGGRTVG